jgi:hypothetical protein
MNMKKYLTAALGVGVALNAYDFVAHGQVLNSMYYSKLTSLMGSVKSSMKTRGDF